MYVSVMCLSYSLSCLHLCVLFLLWVSMHGGSACKFPYLLHRPPKHLVTEVFEEDSCTAYINRHVNREGI